MGSDGHFIPDISAPPSLPVTVEPVETILPSAPTDTSPLYLSQIDNCVAYIVDTVYFYPYTEHGRSREDLIPKLRQCLADILVPYHFMAGRLRLNELGMLDIDCNRKGALFAAASTDLTIGDLGDVARPNAAFRSLVLSPPSAAKMTDNPLLMMQVTRFKCGGFAIGFSMNHAVFDGFGALDFVLNFSSLTRGEGLITEPKPDRTMFKPRNPPQIKFDHPELLKLSDVPKASAFTTAEIADIDISAMKLSQQHVFKTLPVSGEMLERLKSLAMKDESLKKCSSFDAIAAHVWQTRTRAVKMPTDAPAKALFAVDVRNKLNPPLPKGFTGNAVVSAFACVPAKELEDASFSFAVRKIQEATETITDEYIRSSIDWGSVHGGIPNLPGGIFLSAWWKLPFFLVDFGWGKPSYAGPVLNHMTEFVLLLSNGTPDGLNIYIALEPAQMETFEKLLYKDIA